MKSAVTLAQVAEARAGPFVFHDALPEGFAKAESHGFDGVELFLPEPDFISWEETKALANRHDLIIASVGTGAGMVRHGLSLTDPRASKRREALRFILGMIEFGGRLGAPAILGSMQGNWGGEVHRTQALEWLAQALRTAGKHAERHGVGFLFEPLNRYETNLINRLTQGARFIEENQLENTFLLADLFHMNIEETELAQAIIDAGRHIGHVHFADSNRRAMGFGHTNPAPIVAALQQIGYDGFLSAEIFPLPDPETCAAQQIEVINNYLAPKD